MPDQELEATQELVVDLIHEERGREPATALSAEEIASRCGVREYSVEAVLAKLRRSNAFSVREEDDGWIVRA